MTTEAVLEELRAVKESLEELRQEVHAGLLEVSERTGLLAATVERVTTELDRLGREG